jgi:hypothetical protein
MNYMKKISSDDAVSIVIRMCPDTKAGLVAKNMMCMEMVDADPNVWLRSPIENIIADLFVTAKSASESSIQRVVDEHRYGAPKDELHRLLTEVNNMMIMFCETVVHVAAVHEAMKDFVQQKESRA